MLKKSHIALAALALASLAGVILAWPTSPSPATNSHTQGSRTNLAPGHRSERARPPTHRREAAAPDRSAPTWPLPTVPASEIETKRAEMMAAFEAASKIGDPDEQNAALTRICYHWAGFDPRGAVETAIAWKLEEIPGLFENLALQWASADLPSAREWAGMQPPGEFRSELVMRIGYAIAQDDPATAAGYVIRETQPGPVQHEAAIAVLHQWALKDLTAARSWAGSTLTGDLQKRALQEINGLEGYR